MNHHDLWNLGEGQSMSDCPRSFLNDSDAPLDLWHMFVGARQIDNRSIWHFIDEHLQWSEFSIGMDSGYSKTTLPIIIIYFLESFED